MRRPSDLSKTERQEIADLYRSGIPTAEIGEAYDLTHGSVSTVALEEGCTPRHMRKSRLARMHGESPAPSVPTDIAELGLRADAGVPVVNSRIVAERFEKRHDNVLRDIDALISTSSNLRGCGWFRETRVDVPGGNGAILSVRSFDLTRDGFTLLVMGWTGEKALTFKVRYIEAFNQMERALKVGAPSDAAIRAELARLESKIDQVIGGYDQRRGSVIEYQTAKDLLDAHGVPPLGRNGFIRHCSAELHKWCIKWGTQTGRVDLIRYGSEKGTRFFHVDAVNSWLQNGPCGGGSAQIRSYLAKIAGQGILKLVSDKKHLRV